MSKSRLHELTRHHQVTRTNQWMWMRRVHLILLLVNKLITRKRPPDYRNIRHIEISLPTTEGESGKTTICNHEGR